MPGPSPSSDQAQDPDEIELDAMRARVDSLGKSNPDHRFFSSLHDTIIARKMCIGMREVRDHAMTITVCTQNAADPLDIAAVMADTLKTLEASAPPTPLDPTARQRIEAFDLVAVQIDNEPSARPVISLDIARLGQPPVRASVSVVDSKTNPALRDKIDSLRTAPEEMRTRMRTAAAAVILAAPNSQCAVRPGELLVRNVAHVQGPLLDTILASADSVFAIASSLPLAHQRDTRTRNTNTNTTTDPVEHTFTLKLLFVPRTPSSSAPSSSAQTTKKRTRNAKSASPEQKTSPPPSPKPPRKRTARTAAPHPPAQDPEPASAPAPAPAPDPPVQQQKTFIASIASLFGQ